MPGVAVFDKGCCAVAGDSVLIIGVLEECRGDAEALEALSEAPAECTDCCEEVRGDTRPFCTELVKSM